MILILSDGKPDKSVTDVMDWINHFHGECKLICSNDILNDLDFSTTIHQSGYSLSLQTKQGLINPQDINVIWNWRWYHFGIKEAGKWNISNLNIRKFMNEELFAFHTFFTRFMIDKFWWGDKYINKLDVLKKAQVLGLLIPDTLITSQKQDLFGFIEDKKNIIAKPLSNPIFFSKSKYDYGMYTRQLTKEMIKQLPDRFFQTLFQKKIEKEFEIRTFCLIKNFILQLLYHKTIQKHLLTLEIII